MTLATTLWGTLVLAGSDARADLPPTANVDSVGESGKLNECEQFRQKRQTDYLAALYDKRITFESLRSEDNRKTIASRRCKKVELSEIEQRSHRPCFTSYKSSFEYAVAADQLQGEACAELRKTLSKFSQCGQVTQPSAACFGEAKNGWARFKEKSKKSADLAEKSAAKMNESKGLAIKMATQYLINFNKMAMAIKVLGKDGTVPLNSRDPELDKELNTEKVLGLKLDDFLRESHLDLNQPGGFSARSTMYSSGLVSQRPFPAPEGGTADDLDPLQQTWNAAAYTQNSVTLANENRTRAENESGVAAGKQAEMARLEESSRPLGDSPAVAKGTNPVKFDVDPSKSGAPSSNPTDSSSASRAPASGIGGAPSPQTADSRDPSPQIPSSQALASVSHWFSGALAPPPKMEAADNLKLASNSGPSAPASESDTKNTVARDTGKIADASFRGSDITSGNESNPSSTDKADLSKITASPTDPTPSDQELKVRDANAATPKGPGAPASSLSSPTGKTDSMRPLDRSITALSSPSKVVKAAPLPPSLERQASAYADKELSKFEATKPLSVTLRDRLRRRLVDEYSERYHQAQKSGLEKRPVGSEETTRDILRMAKQNEASSPEQEAFQMTGADTDREIRRLLGATTDHEGLGSELALVSLSLFDRIHSTYQRIAR